MRHAKVIPRSAARVELLAGRRVAVLGYGAQGRSHALNLRDSGVDLIVGQRNGSPRHDQARADGFEPIALREAAAMADLLIFGLPDDAAGEVYASQLSSAVRPGSTLGFLHGFVIHYRCVVPDARLNVVLVAPKAQGRGVRSAYERGGGVPVLVAVAQDTTGDAREIALGWAAGIGAHHAGLLETSFADETETDLFGEQAVLCGGVSALIKAAFDTLVENGYPPELAYFECCHELKLLVDLIHEHGLTGMREQISTTAAFGDLTRGPRIVDSSARLRMAQVLAEIRSGAFAQQFLADMAIGAPQRRALLETDRGHPLEQTGRRLRAWMRGEDSS